MGTTGAPSPTNDTKQRLMKLVNPISYARQRLKARQNVGKGSLGASWVKHAGVGKEAAGELCS